MCPQLMIAEEHYKKLLYFWRGVLMFTCSLATVFRTAWEMRLVSERIIFLLLLIKNWVMAGVLK